MAVDIRQAIKNNSKRRLRVTIGEIISFIVMRSEDLKKKKRKTAVGMLKAFLLLVVVFCFVAYIIVELMSWLESIEPRFGVVTYSYIVGLSVVTGVIAYFLYARFDKYSLISPARRAGIAFVGGLAFWFLVRIATLDEFSFLSIICMGLLLLFVKIVLKPLLWLFS